MNRPLQTTLSAAFLLAGCLCFSQAKAPVDPHELLYTGSPILIGADSAWIVQEPRVFSSGRVVLMLFGPGPNEATILTTPRRSISAKEAAAGAVGSPVDASGDLLPLEHRVSVVNLLTGVSRPVSQLMSKIGYASISWASQGRLLFVQASAESRVLDLATGMSLPLPQGSHFGPVPSHAPHLALLREHVFEVAPKQAGGAGQNPFILADFSVRPPLLSRLNLPTAASHPIGLTADGLLVTPDGGIELKSGQRKPVPETEIDRLLMEGNEDRGSLFVNQPLGRDVLELVAREGGARRKVVLSRDSTYGKVNSTGQWVLFESQGAGFAVQLTPIDLAAAVKALKEHAKKNALSFGKQAATAAHIYAADYDSFFPITGGQAKDALMPYLKSGAILDMVIWTNLTGQNVGKLQNPAETELGYVPGPGGRAIIYADGHVVWRPD